MLCAWLSSACISADFSNDYVFPAHPNGLFVLVNHVQGVDGTPIKNGRRQCQFKENGICLADMEGFKITKEDGFFFVDGTEVQRFDPNDPMPGALKVCGYSSSSGSGYNEAYFRKKFGLPERPGPKKEDLKAFDFYYFLVGADSAIAQGDQDSLMMKAYRLIEENNFGSSLGVPGRQ